MFILLAAAAAIYFILGQFSDAWFMSGAIILVSAISIYQDNKSRNAIDVPEGIYTTPRNRNQK
jgi:P-type Ca2+ transporter type 2C